jgi:hypothetical protein
VVTLLDLAGCADTTTGSGIPASVADTTQPGNSATGGPGLASIQPCDLLSSSDASQNQLGAPTTDNGSGARGCTWQNTTANNGDGYVVGVDIRDSQGIKDINTDGYSVTTDNIGSHPGRQLQSTISSSCDIVIGVTNSSRVDVVVAGSNQGCQFANQYAKLIEPNLPAATG